jgi:hypothetical protein
MFYKEIEFRYDSRKGRFYGMYLTAAGTPQPRKITSILEAEEFLRIYNIQGSIPGFFDPQKLAQLAQEIERKHPGTEVGYNDMMDVF